MSYITREDLIAACEKVEYRCTDELAKHLRESAPPTREQLRESASEPASAPGVITEPVTFRPFLDPPDMPTREDWEWLARVWESSKMSDRIALIGNFARLMAEGKLVAVPAKYLQNAEGSLGEIAAERDRLRKESEEARMLLKEFGERVGAPFSFITRANNFLARTEPKS